MTRPPSRCGVPERGAPGPVRAKNTSSRSGVWMLSVRASTPPASRRSMTVRSEPNPPSLGMSSAQRLVVAHGIRERAAAASRAACIVELEVDPAAGHEPLELGGVPSATMAPAIEHRDPVGELIRLVQGTGSSGTPSCPPRRVRARSPTCPARLRGSRPVVGSSRNTMRGPRDQRHREVEPSAHASGVLARAACAPHPTSSKRSSSSATRRLPSRRPRWRRSAMSRRFSAPVSRSSTAEN